MSEVTWPAIDGIDEVNAARVNDLYNRIFNGIYPPGISENGTWLLYNTQTGEYVDSGLKVAPYIRDGNWWSGGNDTGQSAVPKEPELGANETDILWRLAGETEWKDLVSLSEIASNLHSGTAVVTLYADQWAGDTAPYAYTLQLTDVTATSNQEFLPITPEEGLTTAMLATLQAANFQDGGQDDGEITILAYGSKPTIDLPMRVILRGNV